MTILISPPKDVTLLEPSLTLTRVESLGISFAVSEGGRGRGRLLPV